MTTSQWNQGVSAQGGYGRYGDSPYDWGDSTPGWKILADPDWAGDYEFSQIVVWQNEQTGELRAAADSGCSCPTPFANLTLDGMKVIREVDDLRSLVESDAIKYEVKWDDQDDKLAELKARVHRALRDGLPA